MRAMFCTLCATKPTLREKTIVVVWPCERPRPFPFSSCACQNVVFKRIQRFKRLQLATHGTWSRYNVKYSFYFVPSRTYACYSTTHSPNHVSTCLGASPQQTSEQQAFDIHYNSQYQSYYYNHPHAYDYAVSVQCDGMVL